MRDVMRSILAVSAVLAIACGRGKGAASPVEHEPALVNDDDAATEIATARCERERICRRGREEQAERTPETCVRELDDSTHDDLGVGSCPVGIRRDALDTCLSAIESEKCGNPLDSLARIAACRTSALCVPTTPAT